MSVNKPHHRAAKGKRMETLEITRTAKRMTKKSELWQRLRAARAFGEKTQADIAKAVKVSRPTVSLWESRDSRIRTNPSAEQVMLVARECNVPAQYLVDDQASPDDVWTYPRASGAPSSRTPSADESEERQGRAFWSAVEFRLISEQPGLAECFDQRIDVTSIELKSDFIHGRNVVSFTTPAGRSDSATLFEATSKMLMVERATGRTLQKHVLIYARTGTFNIDGKGVFERAFGVTLKSFNDIEKAVEYLRTL